MNLRTAVAATAAATLLAACGSFQPLAGSGSANTHPSTLTQADDGTLIGPNGHTLYTFSKDVAGSGASACYEQCAALWPPLQPTAAAVPLGHYSIIERTDGTRQWAYEGLPLYYYARDVKPGDRQGDGFRGVWQRAEAVR